MSLPRFRSAKLHRRHPTGRQLLRLNSGRWNHNRRSRAVTALHRHSINLHRKASRPGRLRHLIPKPGRVQRRRRARRLLRVVRTNKKNKRRKTGNRQSNEK
jgi:hypothetical protein